MNNQNIKLILSIAILPLMASGCSQMRNMVKSTAATSPGPTFAQAETLEADQDFEAAADSYLAITQNDPQSATAFQRTAICLDKLGLTKHSKPHYLQALKLDPNNSELHCDFGYSSYLQGDLAQAERSYQTAIRLDGNMARAHNNLAQLLAQTNRIPEAVQHLQLAGCNPEQIRQNIAFAAADSQSLIPDISKPEIQVLVAESEQPAPLKTQAPLQTQAPLPVKVASLPKELDNPFPASEKVVSGYDVSPLPSHDIHIASFDYSVSGEDKEFDNPFPVPEKVVFDNDVSPLPSHDIHVASFDFSVPGEDKELDNPFPAPEKVVFDNDVSPLPSHDIHVTSFDYSVPGENQTNPELSTEKSFRRTQVFFEPFKLPFPGASTHLTDP